MVKLTRYEGGQLVRYSFATAVTYAIEPDGVGGTLVVLRDSEGRAVCGWESKAVVAVVVGDGTE